MLTKPRWLLHLEGACVLVLTVILYRAAHFHWWLFAVLLLAPDLAMLGYLWDARIGAALYNLAHTEAGPVLLLAVSILVPLPVVESYALIWLAHLGMDRMFGFGLKYPTQFQDTHLQHV